MEWEPGHRHIASFAVCLLVFAAAGGLVPLGFYGAGNGHCTHEASALSSCYATECTRGSGKY